MSLLIPLGLLGVRYIVPVSVAIITLLVIVYFSYLQTIAAYPSGGGSYTVARFNLGASASLLAAAALLTDYILTAAVGISAGVGALVSAVPSLQPHTVLLCVGILVVIMVLNLRGVHDTGIAFTIPTYLFVGTLLILIAGGVMRVAAERRASGAGVAIAGAGTCDCGGEPLVAAESFCERLHSADRRGSREQRRESFSRARRRRTRSAR